MNPNSESFDQPTQVGKTGGKKLTPQQRSRIFAGLGGVAALAGGSALAWGMKQDGKANDNHPKTESKPAPETPTDASKPTATTPADSTHITTPTHPQMAPEAHTTPSHTESTETTHEPMVATHVTDEMSFDDAFKAARAEVGPGGYFEWNDHLYNTYYKEEWDNLSTKQREEYAATVYGDDATDHNTTQHSTASYDASAPDIKVGEVDGHVVALGDADHDGDAEVIVVDGTVGAIDKDNDGILEIRVQLDPNTHEVIAQAPMTTTVEAPKMSELTASNSSSTPVNNTTDDKMGVHVADYQGHHVIMGDSDHDGDAEVIIVDGTSGAVDTDNDGVMETRVQLDPNTHEVVANSPMTEVYNAPKMNAFDAPQPQFASTSTDANHDVEVVKTTVDSHEVAMADGNHDGFVDVMVMENGIGAVDTDGDHKFETAIQVDMTTGEIVASAPLDHAYDAPTMDSTSAPEHTSTEVAAHDYDNHADVSDWVA